MTTREILEKTKAAWPSVRSASAEDKNRLLLSMAEHLMHHADEILYANAQDVEQERQGDIKYPIAWTTLDEYLRFLEKKGVSVNVASFVGAATVRVNVLGEGDVDPTPEQLAKMRALVVKAMEDGAMGVGSTG